MKKLFVFLILFFTLAINVKAASVCSYQDQISLNQKAANIKRSYELSSKIVHFEDMDTSVEYFVISILNLTEDFYVVVTNNVDDTTLTLNYSDAKDGIVTFNWDNKESITTFNIKVYTSSQTPCPNEVYKTLVITTPRYNKYYETGLCQEYNELSFCQKYVTSKEINFDTFLRKIDDYKKGLIDKDGNDVTEEDKGLFSNIIDYVSKHKWIFIGSMTAILIVIVGVVVVTKKRKQGR